MFNFSVWLLNLKDINKKLKLTIPLRCSKTPQKPIYQKDVNISEKYG